MSIFIFSFQYYIGSFGQHSTGILYNRKRKDCKEEIKLPFFMDSYDHLQRKPGRL